MRKDDISKSVTKYDPSPYVLHNLGREYVVLMLWRFTLDVVFGRIKAYTPSEESLFQKILILSLTDQFLFS